MSKKQSKGIRLNFQFYKGIHKNISIIVTAYMAIILFLFTYLFTRERNIPDADIIKQIKLEMPKNLNEKQQRKYLILIMFQQTGITLMLLAIPLAISLYQFSLINKRSSKRKAFLYPDGLKEKETDFTYRLLNLYPNLTSNDIKLCELLIQNLSSKEIAVELNISPSSVNTARYRLRKKLEIPADQELLTFLHKV